MSEDDSIKPCGTFMWTNVTEESPDSQQHLLEEPDSLHFKPPCNVISSPQELVFTVYSPIGTPLKRLLNFLLCVSNT